MDTDFCLFFCFGLGNEGSLCGRTDAFSDIETLLRQWAGEGKREAKSGITVGISKQCSFSEEGDWLDSQVISLYAVLWKLYVNLIFVS